MDEKELVFWIRCWLLSRCSYCVGDECSGFKECSALRKSAYSLFNRIYEQSKVPEAFAEEILTDLRAALKSNYDAIGERVESVGMDKRYDDYFFGYLDGKITAIRGIAEFIEDLIEKKREAYEHG